MTSKSNKLQQNSKTINEIDLLKKEQNIILYALNSIKQEFIKDIKRYQYLLKETNNMAISMVLNDLENIDSIISKIFSILEEKEYEIKSQKITDFLGYLKQIAETKITENDNDQIVRLEDQRIELDKIIEQHKNENELYDLNRQRYINYINDMIKGRDFFESIKENPIASNKDYEEYSLRNQNLFKENSPQDFRNYQISRGKESSSNNETNKKDYTRYTIIGVEPPYELSNISKRQLPTEIFKYLIHSGIIKDENLKDFSTNQFGRTFESKMGDILTEDELPKDVKRQKRYNLIDFSDEKCFSEKALKAPLAELFGRKEGKFYVSNQWDKNSISKFISYIESKYKKYISIR